MFDAAIEAPFGPVRAVALTFTFVKPPAGPCTTTWLSTVSPRAPERLMEESVPAASVLPTRTRLGATHVLKFECTPAPDTEIVEGEFVALLATTTLPVTLPVAEGANVTFIVADCPGARMLPAETLLELKPAPEAVTLETVTLPVPVFLSTTGRVLIVLVSTLPKLRVVGVALSARVAAFTVSVAAPLVALPAELLTNTVY